jgi:ABC-2 type transport system permease protein
MKQTRIESENTPPNRMAQIATVAEYTFLDYLRSRKFFIVLALVLGITVLLNAVAAYSRLSIYDFWGMLASMVGVFSGVFFGGDAISGEFQSKTGYFIIPNPIRRSSVYLGKWLSAFAACSITLCVVTVITLVNGFYNFGVPSEFGLSVLFLWFYLAAVIGSVFFFSSLFKNSTNSIFVAFMVLVLVFTFIVQLSGLVNVEPWFILSYGAEIIGNILMVPYPPHSTVGILAKTGLTTTTYYATVPQGLAIIGLYFIITTVLGLLIFERKEF